MNDKLDNFHFTLNQKFKIDIYIFNSPACHITSSAPNSTRISGYIHNINTHIEYKSK